MMRHSLWLWFRCRDLDPGSAESREPHAGALRQFLVKLVLFLLLLGVLPVSLTCIASYVLLHRLITQLIITFFHSKLLKH
jgi:hypothetical protein